MTFTRGWFSRDIYLEGTQGEAPSQNRINIVKLNLCTVSELATRSDDRSTSPSFIHCFVLTTESVTAAVIDHLLLHEQSSVSRATELNWKNRHGLWREKITP